MDKIIEQLTKFGFSKELSLKAVAANGYRDPSNLVSWIVSHINDPCVLKQDQINYVVMLSFSPNCADLQHYFKQIYNIIVDHLDFYPTTCENYFSIPLTPIFKVKDELVGTFMDSININQNIIRNLRNVDMALKPFVSDFAIGCSFNTEYSDVLKKYSSTLIKDLTDKKILDQSSSIIFDFKSDDKNLKSFNENLTFPILLSNDPLIKNNKDGVKPLSEALIESLDMQYNDFVNKITGLLNTICMPMGKSTKNETQEIHKDYDITINLFSFDDRIYGSKIYRPLSSFNNRFNKSMDNNILDPYMYVHKPFADSIFDFQAANYDDLTPLGPSQPSDAAIVDDMIFQTSEEQHKLQEYEKDLEKKPADHHLLRPIWKSRMIHGYSHKTGLPISAPRDTLQRVPQICAWNLIYTIIFDTDSDSKSSNNAPEKENGDALPFRQAYDYRLVEDYTTNKDGSNVVSSNEGHPTGRDESAKDSVNNVKDNPDGAPTRSHRILSKIDFYRTFTRFQEGNQYQPEKIPEWWSIAKPDYTIDFEDEKHNVKHRYIIARHGERTDQIFGSDWYMEVFDSEFSNNHYRQRDLNEPRFLPKRKTGLKEFFRDAPLSEVGMFEAYLTGQYMRKLRLFETINWVYTSPSLRSIQTCNYILKGLGLNEVLKIKIEPALFEWYGWYRDYCPTFMSPPRLKNCGFNIDLKYSSLLPEIKYNPDETLADYYARGDKFMRLISKNHLKQAGDILIVGHGATLDVNTRTLLNKPIRDAHSFHEVLRKTPYLAVTRIDEFHDGSWVWPRTPPSLPITYLENTSYDWKILTKNKIKNYEEQQEESQQVPLQ